MTALDEALAAAVAGGAPDTIALMRILMEAHDEHAAREALASARAAQAAAGNAVGLGHLDRIAGLWAATPGAWAAVRGTIAAIAHQPPVSTPDDSLSYWAERFDHLAAAQPEASVALYSLGSPELLAAATSEVVDRLAAWGLIGPDAHVLDLGCGIGRFLQALAPRVRTIIGLDLSARMVAEAQRRCAALANVTVRQSSGLDLAGVADASLDLVLAADVFPYLVEAGGNLAAAHLREAARVLRPNGALLILNYSYRGDRDADEAELQVSATVAGLCVERIGTHDFTLWDGRTILLRQAA